jgi:hypothetical protein
MFVLTRIISSLEFVDVEWSPSFLENATALIPHVLFKFNLF